MWEDDEKFGNGCLKIQREFWKKKYPEDTELLKKIFDCKQTLLKKILTLVNSSEEKYYVL